MSPNEDGALRRIEAKIDRTIRLLDGGDIPERGLLIRMDRLEQSERRRDRWLWGVITTAIGSLAAAIGSLFR